MRKAQVPLEFLEELLERVSEGAPSSELMELLRGSSDVIRELIQKSRLGRMNDESLQAIVEKARELMPLLECW